MSSFLHFLCNIIPTCVFVSLMFGIQLSAQAAANCSTGYKTQTNPFSRWAGCDIAQNGNGITTSSSNGEWSAGFDFGDFIAIKGNAYCLQEQYPMPSQKVCDENTFPISENVDTTKTGSTCWCKVTAWQPFTVSRDAPFQEIDANYIQMPVDNNEPCTLQACGDICASVGDTSAALIGLYYKTAGLRATIYKSVKECVTDANHNPTDCQYGYEYSSTTSQCEAITYTISYELNDGTNNSNNPSSYTIETPTITLLNPTKVGFEFVGWYDNAGFNGDAITQIATNSYGNKTLYAKWASSSCEIGTKTEIQNGALTCTQECADGYTKQTNPFRREHEAVPSNRYYGITFNTITGNPNPYSNGTDFRYDSTLPKGHWRVRFDDFSFVVGGRGVCLADAGSRYGEYIDYKDESQTGSHCWCQLTEHIPRKIVNGSPVLDMDNASILSGKYVYYGDTKPSHSTYLLNSNTCEDWCPMACADETSRTETLTTFSDSWSFLSFRVVLWRYSLRLCKIEDYTITYKDGDEVVDTLNYRITDNIELPTLSPADDKHVFYGWCVDEPNCSVAQTVTGTKTGWYGNKTLYAKWGETETPIVVPESECEPGYYLPQNSDTCAICEENHYCTGGQNSIMQSCATGLVSPTGTISSDNCGKKMLVGEDVLYLTQKQQTTPALAVKIDGKVYYAKTTPVSQIGQPAEHFLRTKIDGVEYSIHDNRF